MLNHADAILADIAAEPLSLSPRRYGLVAACDGGLLEITGLSVPVGALCRVVHGNNVTLAAEVIGFRNGKTLAMLLGDSVMLRPGARVRPEGRPGLLPVGEAVSWPRGRRRRPADRRRRADPRRCALAIGRYPFRRARSQRRARGF